jgi:putative FmdB family regulatory protein|tara:strand:+ start:3224 stop:3517 length:294 start_codon:yes stop_codon:yes gene_type:complete
MPIYDYKCLECDHQFEVIQKFSDEPLKKCPECNLNTVSKMVSAPSFRLKGAGWYETDFKTGTKKNIALDDKKNESSSKKDNKQDKINTKNSKDKKAG